MGDSLRVATDETLSRLRPFEAYKGLELYVFVCYAHEDAALVYPEIQRLKEDGFNIWYDEGIPPGHTWREEVALALSQCEVFLYFITPRSVASSNCLKELNLCLSKGRKILSVHLESTKLSAGLELGLSDVQAIIRRDHSEQDYRRKLSNGLRSLIRGAEQPIVSSSRKFRIDRAADERPASVGTDGEETAVRDLAMFARSSGRVEVQVPRASNRINIAIVPAPLAEDRASLELATSIARYITWDGGPFRAIRVQPRGHGIHSLAIDYLVEITLNESNGQLRAAWQVQRVQTAEIVWANHHHAEELQRHDRVTEMIGEGVLRTITEHELRRIAAMGANELSYGQLVLKAAHCSGWDRARIAERYALLARAIELEPATALAYAVLADVLLWKLDLGVAHDAEADASIAGRAAEQAFELDPNDPHVLVTVGRTYCRIGQYDEGLALIRRAFALAPTIRAKNELGAGLCFAGQPEEAIGLFTEILATMLPASTFRYVFGRLAIALTQAGELEDALRYSHQYVIHVPTDCRGWIAHANLLGQLGRVEDGWRAIGEAQRLVPTLRIEQAIAHIETSYGRSPEQRQRLTAGLRALQFTVSNVR